AASPADAEKIRMPQVVCPRLAAERVEGNSHRRAPDFFGLDDFTRGPHTAPPPPVGHHACAIDNQVAPLSCRRDFKFAVMFPVRLDRRTDEGFAHVPVPQRVSLLIHVELLIDVQLGVPALEAEEYLPLAPYYHRDRFQFGRRFFSAPITVDGQATGAAPAFGMKIHG